MIDDATIEDVKARHPGVELHLLTSGDAAVIIRRPTRHDYARFRKHTADEHFRELALDSLVRSLVVHPDRAGFDAMLNDRPGLCEEFGAPVVELLGLTGKAEAKKL